MPYFKFIFYWKHFCKKTCQCSIKTRIKFLIFPIQGKNPVTEIQELKQVEFEDETIVNSVQKGIKSLLYSRGRYAPRHEQGVHYFHQLLSQYIS